MKRHHLVFAICGWITAGAVAQTSLDADAALKAALDRMIAESTDTERVAALTFEIMTTTTDPSLGVFAGDTWLGLTNVVPPTDAWLDRLDSEASGQGEPPAWRRGLAASYRRESLRRAGDLVGLERTAGRDGVVRDWMVVGPLGFEGDNFLGIPFPPERRIAFDEVLDGTDGKVHWTPYTEAPLDSQIRPLDVLKSAPGVTYALAQIRIPEDRAVSLSFHTPGSAEVFVDGRSVIVLDRAREFRGNGVETALPLARGWHRILVKLASRDADGFSLELRDQNDGPLALAPSSARDGILVETGGVLHEPEAPLAPPKSGGSYELTDARRRFPPSQNRLRALLHAALLSRRGLPMQALARVDSAVDATDLTPAEAFLALDVLSNADELPETARRARTLKVAQSVLAPENTWPFATAVLADQEAENDRGEAGLELIAAALKVAPKSALLRTAEAAILRRLGFDVDHERSVDAMLAHYPGAIAAIESRMRILESRGDVDGAVALMRRVLALDASNADVRTRLARRLIARRDFAGAERELSFLIRAFPRTATFRHDLATLRLEQSDRPGSRQVLEGIVADFPFETSALDLLAQRAKLAGRLDEALGFWKQELARDPNLRHVRAEIELAKRTEPDWFKEYGVDTKEFLKTVPGIDAYSDSAVALLLDQMIVRVREDGTFVQEVHQLRRLQDPRGKDQLGTIEATGEIIAVQTIKPDGTRLVPNSVNRGAFEMAGLEPGVVVEKHVRTFHERQPGRPEDFGGFYFQDTQLVEPYHYTRYVVIVPKKLGLEPRVLRFPGKWKREERGDDIVYDFSLERVPRLVQEPLMPDPSEIAPYVEFRRPDAWDRINRRWLDEWESVSRPTPPIVDAARKVVGDEQDPVKCARKLYDWIMDTIPSEEGRGRPTETLIEKSGDRFGLYMAMLRAVDVPYQLAMGRTQERMSAPIDWSAVSQALFDSPLVRIQPAMGQPIYVITALRWAPFGSIPFALTDAPVFVCSREGGWIDRTPAAPIREAGGVESTLDLELDDAGIARGRISMKLHGVEASQLKDMLERMEKKKVEEVALMLMVRELGRFSAKPTSPVEVRNGADRNEPLEFSVELQLSKLLRKKGDQVALQSPLIPMNLSKSFVDRSERKHPLWFHNYEVLDQTAHVTLAPSWTVGEFPEGFVTRGPLGSFSLRRSLDGRKITLQRIVALEPANIPASDFPKLARNLKEIDAAEQRQIVLKKLDG